MFTGGILGWDNPKGTLELGAGTIYNPLWGNTQVAELDSHSNQNYSQTVGCLTSGSKYVLSFQYAARVGYMSTSLGNVYWNNVLIMRVIPDDE
jgi:hypothetical protein